MAKCGGEQNCRSPGLRWYAGGIGEKRSRKNERERTAIA